MTFQELGSEGGGSDRSLVDLFRRRCQQTPTRQAYVYLRETLDVDAEVTYSELEREVKALAGVIAQRARPGSRVLLLYPQGLEVVRAFWACLYAGMVPIPAPSPDPLRLKNSLPRLRLIARDAQASLILTTSQIQAGCSQLLATGEGLQVEWVATDGPIEAGGESEEIMVTEADLAYLQYTSGSTSAPRGVMISHGNVLAHCESLTHVGKSGRQSRSLSWLPYFHDYGLVHGIIWPLSAGIPSYLLSPVTFLRRPLRWLEAVNRFSITHSGGPNFAYESCVRASGQHHGWNADLNTWMVASCGAEPIHAETVERFVEVFGKHGFRRTSFAPAYGLAEATLLVTLKQTGTEPTFLKVETDALADSIVKVSTGGERATRTIVSCGEPIPGNQLLIVNPVARVACQAGEVGEVWLAGAGIANGYWGRPEETEATFKAALDGSGHDRYLRTGDLGFILHNELFLTGRLKDLIIVRGRNYYPHDLEWTAERAHPGLRRGCGAAFSIDRETGERVVLVFEIEKKVAGSEVADVMANIRRSIADEHELEVSDVVLIKAGTIPRTSSGKIQRHACKAAFESGHLTVVAASVPGTAEEERGGEPLGDVPRSPVEDRVAVIWQEILGGSPPQLHEKFFALGGNSLLAAQVVSRILDVFRVELPVSAVFEYPTVAELATCVSELSSGNKKTSAAEDCGDPTGSSGSQTGRLPLSPAPRQGTLPLSFAQQRLWFLDRLEPDNPFYNIPMAARLSGHLNIPLLEECFQEIIQRHEMLRTTFPTVLGQPQQVVWPAPCFSLPAIDLRSLTEQARVIERERLEREETERPFDLAQGPLIRGKLLRLGQEDYLLLLCLHHIVADGWSVGVLVNELATLYRSRSAGDGRVLPMLTIQYVDYAVWERACLEVGLYHEQLSYWKRQLEGIPDVLNLPTDRPRPPVQQYRGSIQTRPLPRDVHAALDKFALSSSTTRFMILFAAFALLMSRYSGQKDIVIGCPVAHRSRKELEGLIGLFVNTVPLRIDLRGDPTVGDLLAQVRRVSLEALDHQDVPFEHVVEALRPSRDLSRTPIFQVMCAWEPRVSACQLGNVQVTRQDLTQRTAQFDLTLSLREEGEGVLMALEYSSDLFEPSTISTLLDRFEIVLRGMVSQPEEKLSQVAWLMSDEWKQLVVEWNSTDTTYPAHKGLHELFEAQVERTPEATALLSGEQHLTYRELNRRANQLASYLSQIGVGPEILVGCAVERSPEQVVGLLAILKAGGAYLPIDLNYPDERITFMLRDAQVGVLLTTIQFLARFSNEQSQIVCLDRDHTTWLQMSDENPSFASDADGLAYVIYTSGSTGRPKGVEVSHRALVNHATAIIERYGLGPSDRVLQFASLSFDVAAEEIFPTLGSGGVVVLNQIESLSTPLEFLRDVELAGITVLNLPAPYWNELVMQAHRVSQPILPTVRLLVVGSDRVMPDALAIWQQLAQNRIRWFNAYGVTEAAITTTVYEPDSKLIGQDEVCVAIGRPLANMKLYILDSHLQPVPVGVTGELYIGGRGVARGYRSHPDLTSDRFIPNPFVPGGRLYRTGDIGRYRSTGEVELRGRIDHQVKLRGFRIELGEIEATARAYPGVREAIALIRGEQPGQQRIVLYVQTDRESGHGCHDVRTYLASHLPEYMVPTALVKMTVWPMTPNGKIDRQALPSPSRTDESQGNTDRRPLTRIEMLLADIWAAVLGINQVNPDDNFFDLGGDSILSLQVVARSNEVGLHLTPRQLFQYQTIESLAAVAEEGHSTQAEQGNVTGPVPLTPIQSWFFEQAFTDLHHWNQSVLLNIRGSLDSRVVEGVIWNLVQHHDALRLRFHREASGWRQISVVADCPVPLRVLDCSKLSESESLKTLSAAAQDLQRSFDLQKGPLFAAAFCDRGVQDSKLLLVAHHLVVDGVSWRVLLEDLQSGCCQSRDGRPIQFPHKTTSFKQWAERLVEYAQSPSLRREAARWEALADSRVGLIPTDHSEGAERENSAGTIQVSLDEAETEDLLHLLPNTLRVQVHDVLLTAMVRAIAKWTSAESVLIDLEGHGREPLFDELDVSRTVGWFTTLYPVCLRVDAEAAPLSVLRSIKKQLHDVPHGGIGFGLLRYLSRDRQVQDRLRGLPRAQVSWNYLGQYDHVLSGNSLFQLERGRYGGERSGEAKRSYLLDINAFVSRGRLQAEWTYSHENHRRETIEQVAGAFLDELRELISLAHSPQVAEPTTEEFVLASLDESELRKVSALLERVDMSEGR